MTIHIVTAIMTNKNSSNDKNSNSDKNENSNTSTYTSSSITTLFCYYHPDHLST